ncbi:DUF7793 family protein [Chryseosolibacter indicus]|uniref:STAS/SEC14 domain-containing protein n=1 Tax=Chryseosolibacter indicus TaxID=2782351 RepID=A0ABS5VRQ4_9BACT|nr:STAS/SEC14 domain-containing protein [Chryseosolibacter indicus]MBT1703529.1 STAS/SEC14 domain-containing protein [Chryseosolibacter indicus]
MNQNLIEKFIVENEYTKLWIEDGIMFGEYKEDVTIDLTAAQKVVSDRIKLCKNIAYPFLGTTQGLQNLSKEAREYFSTEEGTRFMKKLAIVTTSSIDKMVGNFFLKFNHPAVPTRLFTNQEDALKWLKEDL